MTYMKVWNLFSEYLPTFMSAQILVAYTAAKNAAGCMVTGMNSHKLRGNMKLQRAGN